MDTKSGAIRGKVVTFFGICSLQPSKRGLERLGEGLGRVLDGLGEGFGTVLEGFGRPGGARMETKMREIRGHFATLSQDASRGGFGEDLKDFGRVSCPRMPPGEGLGRIWKGFWEGFVRIWEDLGRILHEIGEGFRLNFQRISD